MDNQSPAKWYTKFLAAMKRKGLKVEDVPEELQPSLLAVHQAATADYYFNHHSRRLEHRKAK
jgi:hypothetical protein